MVMRLVTVMFVTDDDGISGYDEVSDYDEEV